MKRIKLLYINRGKIFLLLLFVVCYVNTIAQTISLAGKWAFKIDRTDAGIREEWFSKKLDDEITLPGSMLENGKGDDVTLQTKWTGSIYDSSWYLNPRFAKYRQPDNLKFPFWLTPSKYYVGAAWYQKEVSIPSSWRGQHIYLFLERCHTETVIWIDDRKAGMQNSMVAPHEYELSSYLSPGKHTITIRIDNRIKEINVGPDSHSLTDHSQGNWNGIVGRMELVMTPPVFIDNIQVYPDLKTKEATVRIILKGNLAGTSKIKLSAKSFNSGKRRHTVNPVTVFLSSQQKDTIELPLPMGKGMLLWDEFDPALYKLNVTLETADKRRTEKSVQFGMREFKVNGTQFMVNGRTISLRGTLDCCEFPLTGYAPMDLDSWVKIFTIAKEHGLNHMRFHSWCPPEAAFMAADLVGFYLQPEGPTWPNHGVSLGDNKPIDQFIYDETNRMERMYGNYPSYCMLAAGNEPAGKNQATYLTSFVRYWQARDNRRVYTGASVAMSWPLVPGTDYMVKSGSRGLNWKDAEPESESDYHAAIQQFNLPYVTHEMGQWCAFPDFGEIKRYTGVYKAKNFELFEEDLRDQGMADEAAKFHLASGKLQVLCYKNEIEKSLRTPGLAGFQLLGLQDFPGQGTALVGTMNDFWENKKYITTKEFSSFCNTTVPLLRTAKFVYTNNETFNAAVEIYHYGRTSFTNATVFWKIKDEKDNVLIAGLLGPLDIPTGKNTPAGSIRFDLSSVSKATQLTIEVGIENTGFVNTWDIWVYPALLPILSHTIYYTTVLDEKTEEVLNKGGNVFLNIVGQVIKGKEISQTFLPVFWNTSWFKMRPPHTLGIVLNNDHPAFADFPGSYHSDLQWWGVVNKSQVMHLEDFPKNFRPLVQPIDTWFMNRRLALIFEAKVGNGKMIVSSADLSDTTSKGFAARQLFYSIKNYMQGDKFNPATTIDISLIKGLITTPSKYTFDAYTKDSPDELKPKTNSTNAQ
jgi:Glycosyl hydrolases family 2, sugar binding domain/Glycosyl hydrolases family 2/Glycosyl hydrolases family 2, TIM barrel domain